MEYIPRNYSVRSSNKSITNQIVADTHEEHMVMDCYLKRKKRNYEISCNMTEAKCIQKDTFSQIERVFPIGKIKVRLIFANINLFSLNARDKSVLI